MVSAMCYQFQVLLGTFGGLLDGCGLDFSKFLMNSVELKNIYLFIYKLGRRCANALVLEEEILSQIYLNRFGSLSWRMCTTCDCKRKRLWVRLHPEKIKYFVFSFFVGPVMSNETKRSVEISHSTRNAQTIHTYTYILFIEELNMKYCKKLFNIALTKVLNKFSHTLTYFTLF